MKVAAHMISPIRRPAENNQERNEEIECLSEQRFLMVPKEKEMVRPSCDAMRDKFCLGSPRGTFFFRLLLFSSFFFAFPAPCTYKRRSPLLLPFSSFFPFRPAHPIGREKKKGDPSSSLPPSRRAMARRSEHSSGSKGEDKGDNGSKKVASRYASRQAHRKRGSKEALSRQAGEDPDLALPNSGGGGKRKRKPKSPAERAVNTREKKEKGKNKTTRAKKRSKTDRRKPRSGAGEDADPSSLTNSGGGGKRKGKHKSTAERAVNKGRKKKDRRMKTGQKNKPAKAAPPLAKREAEMRDRFAAEERDSLDLRPEWQQEAGRLHEGATDPSKNEFEVADAMNLAIPPVVLDGLCDLLNVRINENAGKRATKEVVNQAEEEQIHRISRVVSQREARGNAVPTTEKFVPESPSDAHRPAPDLTRSKRQKSYRPFEHHEADKKAYTRDVTTEELKEYLAINWRAHGCAENIHDLFAKRTYSQKTGRPHSVHPWATNLTTRRRFEVIHAAFHCLREEHVLRFQRELNDRVLQVWVPAMSLAFDESMNDWRGFSPHHVFVRGKPHPNGMKSWVVVDYSGVIVALVLFRRRDEETLVKLPKIHTDTTVIDVLDGLGEAIAERLIVGDRLFGSLSLAVKLIQRNKDVLLACRKDRPNSIFGHWLTQELRDNPDKKLAVAVLYVLAQPSLEEHQRRDNAVRVAANFDGSPHIPAVGGIDPLSPSPDDIQRNLLETDEVVAVEGFDLGLEEVGQTGDDGRLQYNEDEVADALVKEYERARQADDESDHATLMAAATADAAHNSTHSASNSGVAFRGKQTARSKPDNLPQPRVTRSRGASSGVKHVQLGPGRGEHANVVFERNRRRHLELRRRVQLGELVPLGALVEVHGKKHICKLFSVGSTAMTTQKAQVLTKDPDSADSRQMIREEQEIEVTGVAKDYNDRMDPPDVVDKDYYTTRTPIRHGWWAASHVEYQLTMFMTANARRYYMSGNGLQEKISTSHWRDLVFMAWTRPCKLERIPKVGTASTKKKRRCKVCTENGRGQTKTTWLCQRCGPVCHHCSGKCGSSKQACENRDCGGHLHVNYAGRLHQTTRANPLYLQD
jgi:Transposase IS4